MVNLDIYQMTAFDCSSFWILHCALLTYFSFLELLLHYLNYRSVIRVIGLSGSVWPPTLLFHFDSLTDSWPISFPWNFRISLSIFTKINLLGFYLELSFTSRSIWENCHPYNIIFQSMESIYVLIFVFFFFLHLRHFNFFYFQNVFIYVIVRS